MAFYHSSTQAASCRRHGCGHGWQLRVGLEDSLWIGPGELATSNAAQVLRARQIIEGFGLEVATPADAREILSLKGSDKVAF
jgi:uncharacterized protein (DUF849 family)